MKSLLILFISLCHDLHAQEEKSAFESALEQHAGNQTHERWVQVGNVRYREVEYHGEKFYIKFTERPGDAGELDCNMRPDSLNPHFLEMGVQVYHRTQLFISFLQEACKRIADGHSHVIYKLDPRLGFTIPDDPKSVITNKKVFLSPAGLGFSGNW